MVRWPAAVLLFAVQCSAGVLRAQQGAAHPFLCTDDSTTSCSDLEDTGLDLTALAASGASAEKLREAAKVDPPIGNHTSYSGYFTTNASTGNHMFFWHFPAQNGNTSAPLVIWLQGGPGGSSLFGLLAELGPIEATSKTTIAARDYHWNKEYATLFIDNPVGAGYSYTENGAGYVTNEDEVGANLYSFMVQFYGAFPALQSVPLYITGESYGGHYVPAFAYTIHNNNKVAKKENHIPLAGIAVGDGWVDPINMIPAYPEMMYSHGHCDGPSCAKIKDYCDRCIAFIKQGKMYDAFTVWDEMLNGDVWPYGNYFHNITGLNDYDNFLNTDGPPDLEYYGPYVSQASVRKSLHAGNRPFGGDASTCEKHLLRDFHVSMRPRLEALLDAKYKVMIYSGQLDVIIGTALTERFLPLLEWHGKGTYAEAERSIWRVAPNDAQVAGYVRTASNLQVVVVRLAGHLVPHDQPRVAEDMIRHFIDGTAFKP